MILKCQCSGCGSTIEFEDDVSGQTSTCPHCGASVSLRETKPITIRECPCQQCGASIEFPTTAANESVACPGCGKQTLLMLPAEFARWQAARAKLNTQLVSTSDPMEERRQILFFITAFLALGGCLIIPILGSEADLPSRVIWGQFIQYQASLVFMLIPLLIYFKLCEIYLALKAAAANAANERQKHKK